MNLFKSSQAGDPLRIIINLSGDIHTRIAAEIFEADGGIVFADVGWPDNDTGHPFHFVECDEVEGTGPWACGGQIVEAITMIDRDYDEWQTWARLRASDPRSTRESALKAARRGLDYIGSIRDPDAHTKGG